ncbi:MAG TPA: leucine-rich repeat domain-containing protein [Candidatus Avibacteroides excrementipullorum]|nr:leucine-rich repeat domain-containing protein [Candidatus Avibacteroides excrementipullorum]
MELLRMLDEAGVMASGHFSDKDTHLSWVLTDDGTLAISGKGNIADVLTDFDCRVDDTDYFGACHVFYYPEVCCYPWFAYHDLIKVVVFGEGIECLGVETFMRYWNIEKIILPDSLKFIGDWAFYGCTRLMEVIIPANVTMIARAFYDCCNLKKVTCLMERPIPIKEDEFYGIAKDAVLYVPESSVDAYRQDDCWNKFYIEVI